MNTITQRLRQVSRGDVTATTSVTLRIIADDLDAFLIDLATKLKAVNDVTPSCSALDELNTLLSTQLIVDARYV